MALTLTLSRRAKGDGRAEVAAGGEDDLLGHDDQPKGRKGAGMGVGAYEMSYAVWILIHCGPFLS